MRTIREVARGWTRFECTALSAGLAFYAAVSIFPLMLLLVAGMGFFLEATHSAVSYTHLTLPTNREV